MKKNSWFLLITLFSMTALAQVRKMPLPNTDIALSSSPAAKKSPVLSLVSKGMVKVHADLPEWHTRLVNHSVSHRSDAEADDSAFLLRQAEKEQRKAEQVAQNQRQTVDHHGGEDTEGTMAIFNSFDGNETSNWYPPDNHIAISNAGMIVGVINSQVSYFDTNGNLLESSTFDNLFSQFELSSDLFDPRVVYDPIADRFIMLILNDRTPEKSKILLCFSISNNPLEGWYLYELSGNPLNNNTWFDYPSVGISQNELYISGNSFSGGFDQALLYQIGKAEGYNGDEISFQYWYDIQGNPYTLVPLSWGQNDEYGPGCYLIATAGASNGSAIKFYDLTDDLTGNPEFLYYNVPIEAYESGTAAFQKDGTKKLRAAGTVIRSAFYLNGVAHYVFAKDRDSGSPNAAGWNGISYNRLRLSDLTNTEYILSGGDVDLCYPAIASSGATENDAAVTMVCLASSENIYPEMRTMQFDNNMIPTALQTVRTGNGAITFGCDATCRWGDYTGIQRKYNTVSETWMMGQVARANGNWRNWIAGSVADPVGVANVPIHQSSIELYPNPTNDLFQVDFMLAKSSDLRIDLYNMLGQNVKTLYSGTAMSGKNSFSFNRKALPSGIYVLRLTGLSGDLLGFVRVVVE